MCFKLFKKKYRYERMIPKTKRTKDNRPFYIPQITSIEDKKRLRQDFISPAGVSRSNAVSVVSDRKGTGDIDKKYDVFRTKKKLTKEEAKKRFGHSYYEFISVNKDTIPKVYSQEGINSEDVSINKRNAKETSVDTNAIIEDHKHIHSVPVDEFFESEKAYESKTEAEQIEEDEVLKDLVSEAEEKTQETPVQFEEDEEDALDDVLFEKPKEKEMDVEDIEFDEDIDYEDYQPEEAMEIPQQNLEDYQLPPLTLFKKTKETENIEPAWVKENTDVINETLFAFSIEGKVTNYTVGPTVTRYEVSLGSGVPTKKITGISDNLQMNLSAVSLRIEAPIPGKNTIGIEVPNKTRKPV
ncbi:MAG TPA: DNA translocase FtsK, partial [Candidatus Izemoplasmatales bacterium]|nr:DNA translocase FtsK [Candidatus Izemoplasmatales bacterium]